MLRFILATTLLSLFTQLSLVMAAQAASPLELLSQQCLEYELQPLAGVSDFVSQASENQSIEPLALTQHARQLERQLIGLYNLKDSVDYYRQYAMSSNSREALLQCQLHLGDQFHQLTQRPDLIQLSQALLGAQKSGAQKSGSSSGNSSEEQLLGKRLGGLLSQQEDLAQKARFHSLEASVKHALTTQALSLIMPEPCQLPDADKPAASSSEPFQESIAAYLLKQQDGACRRQVWQAYQIRAKQRNQLRLQSFIDDKQKLASLNRYADFASYQLSEQYLNTPELVAQFLDAITAPTVAPWDLALTLSQSAKTDSQAIDTNTFIDSMFEQLKPFGIKAEMANPTLVRLWHQGRLLGDIYLQITAQSATQSDLVEDNSQTETQTKPERRSSKTKIVSNTIRQGVIGLQFGQGSFSAPATLDDYRAQLQAIEAMSQQVARLLKGGHYYLLNTLGESQDSAQVGEYWLSEYLSRKLLPAVPNASREAYLAQYDTQLKVFRSKLALAFYKNRLDAAQLSRAFKQSFAQDWPQAVDAIYSFSGILDQGPLYYQSLWQKQLAQLIYHNGKEWQKQQQTFTILLINEAQLPFSAQLKLILGEDVSPSALIKRIQHEPIPSEL
ncbi:M3 family metallopeptidase [Shewanella sp. AS1]|uniref:M3 family metallopeptidase n=1 Tax=Shewanella sp. AS1 TaxID=2907626 RepID=UPI001F1F4F4A|nr:M3 family metallopeptidase [Shewanella sp. AS1]MCE9678798.1 M3 family metallopeptidase [Shewanella sp. AS1]